MKARVKYKTGTYQKHYPYARVTVTRQKTIEVDRNEPNSIVRKFIEETGFTKSLYITTIRCERTEYQWYGEAREAFG